MESTRSIIIHGPQACGKTRNAKALADHFGCTSVIDSWDGVSLLPAKSLALTCEPPPYRFKGRVIAFREACRLARIKVS